MAAGERLVIIVQSGIFLVAIIMLKAAVFRTRKDINKNLSATCAYVQKRKNNDEMGVSVNKKGNHIERHNIGRSLRCAA